jgi:hypothetical protein
MQPLACIASSFLLACCATPEPGAAVPGPSPATPVAIAPVAVTAEPATPVAVTPEPAPAQDSGRAEPAAGQDSAAGRDSAAGEWQRRETDAPYARAETESLAVLIPREPTRAEADARARKAFEALTEGERAEVIEWFDVECQNLGTFQGMLLRYVLDGADRAAEDWPDLAPLAWFDPDVHAPAQPIPRKPLDPSAPEVTAVRNQILAASGSRTLDSGWMYDYAARSLVRLPHAADPARIFANGLAGMPPNWDLAEALVERALDDGSLQQVFQAFSHAYTDRWGGVYPGVTLYDAHASNTQLEMPDVDTLGIVHEAAGDWDTWKSVVPPNQHESLYGKVGELFAKVHRHRGLRTNLARTYLCGSTELRDNYQHNLDNFHALWESASSEPATLLPRLPDPDGWYAFLQGWADSFATDAEVYHKGLVRRTTLDQNSYLVRQKLLWVLDQFQAFRRIETLPPFDGQ